MKVLYLDESGDHDLVHIRPAYSVFVIGGIIVDREYDRTVLQPEVTRFKREWFDTDAIILHSVDIFQGKKGFQRLRRDRSFRLAFLADLQDLLARLDYQVVACVIHKDKHVAKYGAKSPDPYDFGLQVVVERFCFEIGDVSDGGIIVAEKRRHDLDHNLDVAWEKLRVAGTYQLNKHQRGQIDKRIVGMSLKAKSVNIAGLQLADLVITPVGRQAMGLDPRGFWDIVAKKMCQKNGIVDGYGLVTLPKP